MRKWIVALIAIMLATSAIAQTTGVIKGVVLDEQGNPLPGANVVVVGTTYGAATDNTGKFVFSIAPGQYAVRASFMGYESKTIQNVVVEAGKETELTFTLKMTALLGEEVVVIGYGVQKKKDVTGAATTVRVKDLQKVTETDVSTMLQGQIAGVDVSRPSGAPGAGASIKIRGAGTLGGTDPLIIVDGVPSSMSAVNPNDIESIDILKDASAAAIYGSRAGNGVILITTKRGEEGPVKVSFESRMSLQSLAKKFPLVTNADDYISIVKQAYDNAGMEYPEFVTLYEQNPEQFSSGTDWQDEYYRTALLQDYNLSISGGVDNAKFAVSGHYADQQGIVINNYDKRMGLRINSDFVKGNLKVGESLSIRRFIGKQRYTEGATLGTNYAFFHLSGLSPLVPVYDKSNPTGYAGQDYLIGFYREIDNIVARQNLEDDSYDNIHLLASAYLEYKFRENLVYTARASQNIWNGYNYYFAPKFQLSPLDLVERTNLSETRSRSYHTIIDNYLNYNTTIGSHRIEAMVGFSREQRKYRSTYGYVEEFPANNLRVLGAGTENDNAWGEEIEWRYLSFFGRLNYSLMNRYLLQVNFRRDGSSRFSEENRWGNFPSVSLGWRISDEPFFNVPVVDDLKLRGSYGVLGMQEFPDYMYYATIAYDDNRDLNYPFGPGKEQPIFIGARSTGFASLGLKWEESKQTNIGLDASLLDGQLGIEFDYYIKKNEDILFAPTIPYSTGASYNPTVNVASVKNSGVELSLNYRELLKPFKYDITFTMSTNKNELTSLGNNVNDAIFGTDVYWAFDAATKSVVGRPIGSFYLYQTDGIFKSQEEVDNYLASGGAYFEGATPHPGDVKYVDTNGDGVIDSNDKVFFGTAQPAAEFGLNLNFSYKRFDFSVFFHAVTGRQMYNGAKLLTYWTNHAPGNYHKDLLNAWSESNPDSDIPRVVQGDQYNVLDSDLWLEDADYLKIRHVELGYRLPENLIYGYGIQSLRLFVAADNLLTITGYTGYDPSIDYGTLFSRGIDRSPYPIPRAFVTGIQIGF